MSLVDLVATCWTSAGNVRPLDVSEVSPHDAVARVRAVADTGWMGMGFAHDDLKVVRDSIGFEGLHGVIQDAGLRHVEVELASGWWKPDDSAWRPTWELLLEAASVLDASFIKIGTDFGDPVDDLAPFVAPLRRLAQEAEAIGTRVALEPLPFSLIGSLPQGAQLIEQVGQPAAGLIVDFWHVYRAGTSLDELEKRLDPASIFGVELNDADAAPVGTLFEDTRDRRRYLGEGVQDVGGFVRTLRHLGFDGPWGVEILSDEHRGRELVEGLRYAHDSTAAYFQLLADQSR